MIRSKVSVALASILLTAGAASAQSGLVAYYPFDGNFRSARDGDTCSPDPLDAVPHGGVTFAAGRIEQCAWFDGQSGWLEVTHTGQLTFDLDNASSGSYTIGAFFYLLDGAPEATIIQDRYGANVPVSYDLGIHNDQARHQYFADSWYGSSGTTFECIAGGVAMTNAWHHIAVSYDSLTGVKTLYIDGIRRSQEQRPSEAFAPNATNKVTIGGYFASTLQMTNFFKGGIDDLRIYNRALSRYEVRELSGDVCRADVDGDGSINVADFSAFLQQYVQGCH